MNVEAKRCFLVRLFYDSQSLSLKEEENRRTGRWDSAGRGGEETGKKHIFI